MRLCLFEIRAFRQLARFLKQEISCKYKGKVRNFANSLEFADLMRKLIVHACIHQSEAAISPGDLMSSLILHDCIYQSEGWIWAGCHGNGAKMVEIGLKRPKSRWFMLILCKNAVVMATVMNNKFA